MAWTHNCRSMLCDTPHYENDDHSGDCLCELCHEHDWTIWNVYPECDGCLMQLSVWLAENTDYFELQRQYGRAA